MTNQADPSTALLQIPGVSQVEYHETIPSTNTRARELAESGAPHGTVVIARAQSAGRGRFDRRFVSPRGAGIYLSYLYRGTTAAMPYLTSCAAVAAAEAIESLVKTEVKIKWVNDLWLSGKKIAGILTEAAWTPEGDADYAIIGIGINVLHTDLPAELAEIATSVEEATGTRLSVETLTTALLTHLTARLASAADRTHLVSYAARSSLDGKRVTVQRAGETFDATVCGIGENGELLLTLTDGTPLVLASGEVTRVREVRT